ncbi:hsp70-binding protein 1 [Belonocnema kinseyi]|uniref:hsp70-binding protein 1 n=1 Tax=Belonocnema kinseyi TaxID=2817044 RepID=UPI00143DED63|nr:hsp70-binding protein 1 [Belonocnema kinseyi]
MGASHTRKQSRNMNSNNAKSDNSSRQDNASSNIRPLSIEGPRTQDLNQAPAQPIPNQPRQPVNLQGLLRFALEATKSEDAPHESRFQPLDAERKKFLNEALASMTVNVIEELQKSIKILENVVDLRPDDNPADYEAALERISEFADSTDVANDFYKIGGFSIFGPCLNSPHSGIRWRVADLIAELSQNNPFCQEKILEAGYMPILLNMVDTDPCEQARVKALYAVSCIVRGHSVALKHMEVNDGYSILLRAIQSPVEKLQIKSAFLLSSLSNRDNLNDLKATLIKMGLVEQIAGLLTMGNLLADTKEQLLSVLGGLTNNGFLPALKECRRPELCLKPTLERHLKDAKAEDSLEREDICKDLLDKIFSDQRSQEQER